MDMRFLKEMFMARTQRDDTQGARTVIGEANPPVADREKRIAEAAYHRWQKRGGEHGSHEQDWLDAESEIDREDRRPRP